MPRLTLHLFGAPSSALDGLPVHVPRRKGLALLAFLALVAQGTTRDELATLLWPELDQRGARAMLRHTLSTLRQAVGRGWLALDDQRVMLVARPDLWVDVRHFRALLAQVAAHDHHGFQLCDGCVAALTEAAGLYTGPFLAGFALPDAPDFEAWQSYQAELLQRELAQALEQLAHVHAQAGRRHYQLALAYAQRWLALDPLHEPAHRTLMRLYARAGDRTAALQQYERCVQTLAAELAVEPELETQQLAEQIRAASLVAQEGTASQEPSAPAVLGGRALPAHAIPFIGRERELEQVAARLADPDCRLLTILGPGGIGKTRLAVQAMHDQAGRFAHGICFVDLAPVDAVELMAPTLLRVLDVPGSGDSNPQRRLADFLRRKQMLLVLDSFEHLLAGAGLLTGLLQAAPRVKLLVTSRVRLNVREEWLEPLAGLAVPPHATTEAAAERAALAPAGLEDYAATRLFVYCMRRLQPDVALDQQAASTIATLCRQLAGMPLGIELAAAWTRTLSLDQMQREMAHGLRFLSTALRDMPPRHQSMRAVFDQSWQLLSPREQGILRQLAVFRGGCTLDAAAAVTGAGLGDLAGLVDKSWLRMSPAGRYEMHELVRQYGEERLEDEHAAASGETADQVRQRHGTYYGRALAATMHKVNYASDAIDEVMAEWGNVQAGLRWAVQAHDLTSIHWMSLALYFVVEMLGWFHEVYQLYQLVVDLLAPEVADHSDRARWQEAILMQGWVLFQQSNLCIYLAQMARCRTLAEQNLTFLAQVERSDDQQFLEVMSQWVLALCALRGGEYQDARRRLQAALTRYQDPDLPQKLYERPSEVLDQQAIAYTFLGHTAFHQGEYAEAEGLMRQGRMLREQIGEQRLHAHHASWLARVLQVQGRYAEAESVARAGLAGTQKYGDRISEANAWLTLGRLERELGRYEPARMHLQLCAERTKQWGHLNLLLEALAELGRLELAVGNPAGARQLGEEALAAFARAGPVHSNNLAAVHIVLGWAALADQDAAGAQHAFRQALRAKGRLALDTMEAIAGLGQVAAQLGDLQQALALFALVEQHPFTAHGLRLQVRSSLHALQQKLAADAQAAPTLQAGLPDVEAVVAELLQAETI